MGLLIAGTIIVACFISISVSTPITIVEVIDFEDTWDYKVEQHHDPLLKISSKFHELPKDRTSKDLENEEELQSITAETSGSLMSKLTCPSCKIGISLFRTEIEKGASIEELKETFVSTCVGLEIANLRVCTGVFDMYAPPILPALKVCTLETSKICSLLLGETCGHVENPLHEWTIPLTDAPADDIWQSPTINNQLPTFKVLHLSDTHFDPQYQINSAANCGEPLCCRNYSSLPDNGVDIEPAGKWGSYQKCDSPQILIENMLDHIKETHTDIDFVILTGDIPPHDIWNQTKDQHLANIKFTIGEISKAFPGIPVFPALGNHEGIPSGNFPPPWMKHDSQSIQWLYDEIAKEWAKWLPSEVNSTIHHGGFYSVLVRPKFRIISLNTNYCHALSWWLVLNSTDPAQELKWLVRELQMAEDNNEKVHIIGHIPPGYYDCLKIWSKNYYDIINRYKNTVVAQFFGHTHTDEFKVFYDNKEFKKPVGVAYIGPSVTTFELLNPGYRIYYVAGDFVGSTNEVIDHETWIMDLAKANASPDEDPEWYKLYSARSAYGMTTLRPQEWGNLINLMVKDDKVFNKFHRFYYKSSPVRPQCIKPKCRFELICDLKTGKSNDRHHLCKEEKHIIMTP